MIGKIEKEINDILTQSDISYKQFIKEAIYLRIFAYRMKNLNVVEYFIPSQDVHYIVCRILDEVLSNARNKENETCDEIEKYLSKRGRNK